VDKFYFKEGRWYRTYAGGILHVISVDSYGKTVFDRYFAGEYERRVYHQLSGFSHPDYPEISGEEATMYIMSGDPWTN